MTANVYGAVNAEAAIFPTTPKTGAYTASPGDLVAADISGGSWTLTLPSAPANLTRVAVKLIATNAAATNVLTVACSGTDRFNEAGGPSTATVTLLNQGQIYQYASGIWYITDDSLPLSQLDARYLTVDWVSVKAHGAAGNGTADDTTAIRAAITAAGSTGTVYLPAGTYEISSLIERPPGVRIIGAGRSGLSVTSQTVIRASAAMPAMLASTGWLEGTNTGTHTGAAVQSLKLDGNNLATHGIVSQDYDALFADLEVANVTGDGLRFDAFSQSGTVQITSTGVNNRVTGCSFQSCGRGLVTNEATGGTAVYTDGFALNCIVDGVTGAAGIAIGRGSGWLISGNHLYGLSQHGIQAGQMAATRIVNNYVETWGGSTSIGTYRAIDAATIQQSDSGNGIVISGNTLRMAAAPGNAGSTIQGVSVLCANSNSTNLAVTGNILRCAPATGLAASQGFVYANNGSAAVLTVASTGNLLTGTWTTAIAQTPNGGTITVTAGT